MYGTFTDNKRRQLKKKLSTHSKRQTTVLSHTHTHTHTHTHNDLAILVPYGFEARLITCNR